MADSGLALTARVTAAMSELLEREGMSLPLRVACQPSNSGLRYQVFFDERTLDGDTVSMHDGLTVVVDRMSGPYLAGSTLDLTDEGDGLTVT